MNKLLFFGAVLGLLSVIMGAYADHGLAAKLSEHDLKSLMTAIRYHQLYAVIIAMLGLLVPFQLSAMTRVMVAAGGYLFLLGVLLFSFSIYISAMTGHAWIVNVVPFGGITLMAGWCCLVMAAFI